VTFHALLLKGLRSGEETAPTAPCLGTSLCPVVGRGWRIFNRFEDWNHWSASAFSSMQDLGGLCCLR
jgi:hypothetical protein